MLRREAVEKVACLVLIFSFFVCVQVAERLVRVRGMRVNLAALVESVQTPESLRAPIFIYHSVRPFTPGESAEQNLYDVTPELFEEQLIYLREHGYTTITPDELAGYFSAGTMPSGIKPVLLTFDDGWANQYTYAFPLLKKYKMRATFYIFTNPIGKRENYLNWGQIKEMSRAGMIFGSHTLSHPYLNKLSAGELHREIVESRFVIEKELGETIINFASPYGYTSGVVVDNIKQAEYLTGRTTRGSVYHTRGSLYELGGFLVSDSLADFVKILEQ